MKISIEHLPEEKPEDIDSRHKLDYTITREDLEYLGLCVGRLRNLTEIACKETIEGFLRG